MFIFLCCVKTKYEKRDEGTAKKNVDYISHGKYIIIKLHFLIHNNTVQGKDRRKRYEEKNIKQK